MTRRSVIWPLIGVQFAAGMMTAGIFAVISVFRPAWLDNTLAIALTQGALAAFVAARFEMERWWWAVHALLPVAVAGALALALPPWIWLFAFVITFLVYWRTDSSRVPLYLSNADTAEAVAAALPPGCRRVVDLGCGEGGLLARLARAHPGIEFIGIEHAPVPWLIARLRAWGVHNLQIHWGNLWALDVSDADVVYAFLSPEPMPTLWTHLCDRLPSGALLISNSFEVPGVAPARIIEVDDRRATRLFVYQSTRNPPL